MTGKEAAEMLGITVRHTRRLLGSYRLHRASGLANDSRGREPVNKLDEEMQAEILHLTQTGYVDYNDSHFTEELEDRHQIEVSRPTTAHPTRAWAAPLNTSKFITLWQIPAQVGRSAL